MYAVRCVILLVNNKDNSTRNDCQKSWGEYHLGMPSLYPGETPCTTFERKAEN